MVSRGVVGWVQGGWLVRATAVFIGRGRHLGARGSLAPPAPPVLLGSPPPSRRRPPPPLPLPPMAARLHLRAARLHPAGRLGEMQNRTGRVRNAPRWRSLDKQISGALWPWRGMGVGGLVGWFSTLGVWGV